MGACCGCFACCGGKLPENPEYIGVWTSDDKVATLVITPKAVVHYRTTTGVAQDGVISSWHVKQTQHGGFTFRIIPCCGCCECCGYEEFDVAKPPERSHGQFQRSDGGQYKTNEAWRMIVNQHRFIRET